jgi:DNA-binding CsgD family transcriptional regulator
MAAGGKRAGLAAGRAAPGHRTAPRGREKAASRKRAVDAAGSRVALEEAARHCRALAGDVCAAGFGLLVSTPAAEHPLLCVFDCDFPLASPYLTALLAVHAAEVSRHAIASSAPLCWGPAGEAALPWASRLESHGGLIPGVALPCYSEHGTPGLVVFWGRKLAFAPQRLTEIHARAFALFEAVSLIRAEAEARRPQMSKRELECLELTAEGHTSEAIAAILSLSVHTTNQHLAYAAQKLDAVNRIHAVAKALRLGLIE